MSQTIAAPERACVKAPVVLVHPTMSALYEDAVAQVVAGIRERTHAGVGVCSIDELPNSALDSEDKTVVAVGENAYAAATRFFAEATVVPILVRDRPNETRSGVSLYLDPTVYFRQLRALSPDVNAVALVHRDDVSRAFLDAAQAAAAAHAMRFTAISVVTLRDAALAVENVMRHAGPREGVWFQRSVVGMNADLLLPKIVALSWENRVPVFSEEAEYVARGMLFALTHDYRELGRAVADTIGSAPGFRYPTGIKRVVNRRTAQAIGIPLQPGQEKAFDYVYE